MNKLSNQRANHRSRIIDGQIKSLVKAIDDDKYCVDVLIQSLAIQKSLKSLNRLVLEKHMKTHLAKGMMERSQKKRDELIDEMLGIYELTNARS